MTREVASSARHEVTITYYRSALLERRYPQPREIADLLNEYAAASGGRVTVRVVDPRSDDAVPAAESLGVVPRQLQTSEGEEQRIAVVYSGIVVEYLDRRESIPFVFGTSTLEYDLTRAIRDLVRGEGTVVAIVVGDPARTLEADYRLLANGLAVGFEVRPLRAGEPIPDEVDVALLIDAQRLESDAVASVASYLARGGALFAAYDAVEVSIAGGLRARTGAPDAIRPLLAEYGIRPGETLLLDEEHNQIPVEETTEEFRLQRLYPYPHWPVVPPRYTSADHPVTARFEGLDLYWPTYVEAGPPAGAVSIIAASSPRAWTMAAPFRLAPQAAMELSRGADETRGQYGVVAVSGGVESNGRVALVADADFLRDELIQAGASPQNINFARNLIEWLASDEALLTIRTRPVRSLALDAIDEPAVERTAAFFARAVNMVLVPAAVVAAGIVRYARRRRRARLVVSAPGDEP